jgi:hypothetical protein
MRVYIDIPRRVLPQRYGCSIRTIQYRRAKCGHDTSRREPLIPLNQVIDLDDWWICVNRSWGLSWTERQFIERVIEPRLHQSEFTLNHYLKINSHLGFKSREDLLIRAGFGNKLKELERYKTHLIDVQTYETDFYKTANSKQHPQRA